MPRKLTGLLPKSEGPLNWFPVREYSVGVLTMVATPVASVTYSDGAGGDPLVERKTLIAATDSMHAALVTLLQTRGS